MTITGRDLSPVPDLWLEQHAVGELDAATARTVGDQLASSPALRARLEAIERSNVEIRARYPAEMMTRQAMAAANVRSEWPRRAAMALVAAGVVTMVATPWLRTERDPAGAVRADAAADARVKGTGAALAVYRKTAAGSEALRDGDAARAGDVLRVGYQSTRAGFGAIVSVDGRGAVTRHYPVDGATAAPLQAGTLVLLDDAFELDDAPRWERFHLFASDAPFDVAPLIRALGTPAGDPPPGLEHATLSLVKEPTP
jgi:hypothetical protein